MVEAESLDDVPDLSVVFGHGLLCSFNTWAVLSLRWRTTNVTVFTSGAVGRAGVVEGAVKQSKVTRERSARPR